MPDKCTACGKTVYPLEAIAIQDQTWHKNCFKCSAEGCGLKLALTSANCLKGVIYCNKHKPVDKPTSTTVEGNMALNNAKNAPKVETVNQQVLSMDVDRKGTGALSYSQTSQKNAPKVETVNDQVRSMDVDRKGTGALSYSQTSQKNAPKVDTVNDQVRQMDIDRKGTGALSYSQTAQKNAPKVDTVNDQVRQMDIDRKPTPNIHG